MHTPPGHIGRYRLEALLGQGAMGVVYRAFDPRLQRSVALKTIQPALLTDAAGRTTALARLRNEARAAGRIAHPGVVAIFDWHDGGEHARDACIAMELVDGRNLAQILAATPRLDAARVLDTMRQLLDALAAAHGLGIWHRDIKPSNLLVAGDGRVKLSDFGVARLAPPAHAGPMPPEAPAGTAGAMAPELYRGDAADHRADLFSCGVLLRRLAAGLAPAPAGLEAVVARAMAFRPGLRYPGARDMRLALESLAWPSDAGDGATFEGWSRPPAPCDDSTLPGFLALGSELL